VLVASGALQLRRGAASGRGAESGPPEAEPLVTEPLVTEARAAGAVAAEATS
jgi:hypothetical protein